MLAPATAVASGSLALITGTVRDSGGAPIVGALVIAAASIPSMPERMAFTDKRGSFSIPNLFGGEYSVKVTMPRFLPATKTGIQLKAGNNFFLTVSLQNAWDVVRRAISRDQAQADEMLWTLRSSRSNQPVLRLADAKVAESNPTSRPDYSGYLQVYSKSVDTPSGTDDVVGSQFSLTMPLAEHSKVIFAGHYGDGANEPRGFGARYQFSPTERHRAAIDVNIRQGFSVDRPDDDLREIQVEYGENFQWSDHLVVNYGAEIGRADSLSGGNYLRPRIAVAWVPETRTTITIGTTSQAPTAPENPIRGREYFEKNATLTPGFEQYSHSELSLSKILSDNSDVSIALFRDRIESQAIFVAEDTGPRRVLVINSRNKPANGIRLNLNRAFGGYQAGIGYANASGLSLHEDTSEVGPVIQERLELKRFHVVSTRFKANLDSTRTELTAVYRWISAFSSTRLDPYQRSIEFNDPSLSVTVAQALPTWGILPGRIQAILDARNLFEHSSGPKAFPLFQYPRMVKGGINIKF